MQEGPPFGGYCTSMRMKSRNYQRGTISDGTVPTTPGCGLIPFVFREENKSDGRLMPQGRHDVR